MHEAAEGFIKNSRWLEELFALNLYCINMTPVSDIYTKYSMRISHLGILITDYFS